MQAKVQQSWLCSIKLRLKLIMNTLTQRSGAHPLQLMGNIMRDVDVRLLLSIQRSFVKIAHGGTPLSRCFILSDVVSVAVSQVPSL